MQKGNWLYQGWSGQEQTAEGLNSYNCLVNIRLCITRKPVQACVKKKKPWEPYVKFLLRVCSYIMTALKATTKFSYASGRTKLNSILRHVCSKKTYYRMGIVRKEKSNSKSWQQHTPWENAENTHPKINSSEWETVIERIASWSGSEWELLEWNRRGRRSVLSIKSIDYGIQSLAQ